MRPSLEGYFIRDCRRLLLITRGLSPGENSTANRVAAPPAKSLLKLLWKHRTTGEGMCEIERKWANSLHSVQRSVRRGFNPAHSARIGARQVPVNLS
jgi:hypothetical protein